jgi:CPA1 family monovalent cation:H+ antiporter
MAFFDLFSAVFVMAAVLSYVNHRFVRAPTTIGVMTIALVLSLALVFADVVGIGLREPAARFLDALHFEDTLLGSMLALLLFAGALHVDLGYLYGQKKIIALLATVGVVLTTFVAAVLVFYAANLLGLPLTFLDALLFGALISPTDPIAVLGILKNAKAPKSLETKIAGESLFNDGIGVVVFLSILGVAMGAQGAERMTASDVGYLLLTEVGGGVALGLAGGYAAYRMIATIDDYQVEVLISLALAMGLYSGATALHMSGPLAVVVAGLLIGNTGREFAMSETTQARLDDFWELVDELLNVVLFVLIGLELLVLELDHRVLLCGVVAIPLVLFARFISVGGAVTMLRRSTPFSPHTIKIMTWGGLRGGISVALALSIPHAIDMRDELVTITYVVVVFSILVQGLTVGKLIQRIPQAPAPDTLSAPPTSLTPRQGPRGGYDPPRCLLGSSSSRCVRSPRSRGRARATTGATIPAPMPRRRARAPGSPRGAATGAAGAWAGTAPAASGATAARAPCASPSPPTRSIHRCPVRTSRRASRCWRAECKRRW